MSTGMDFESKVSPSRRPFRSTLLAGMPCTPETADLRLGPKNPGMCPNIKGERAGHPDDDRPAKATFLTLPKLHIMVVSSTQKSPRNARKSTPGSGSGSAASISASSTKADRSTPTPMPPSSTGSTTAATGWTGSRTATSTTTSTAHGPITSPATGRGTPTRTWR